MSPYPPARTIPWHGQEWLIRVDSGGSIVARRTASPVIKAAFYSLGRAARGRLTIRP
jgi:hypothetical protein